MGRRILIVNVNWLGDVLFSTPAIRALRKSFPDSFLACLVPARCQELLTNNPYLNEVIPYDERISFLSIFKSIKTIRAFKKRRFDTAVFFHRSKTKVALAALAGIPERWGYGLGLRAKLLTRSYPVPDKALHKTDEFLNLLQNFGVAADGRAPDFFPKKEAENELCLLMKGSQIPEGSAYVVVHAGGNWALKRWPASYFTAWIRLVLKKFRCKVILCGTASEEAIAKEIQADFDVSQVVSLCGKTTVDTLALLLKGAKLVVSNDSGPIHLAATQKANIVGLFGPTHPKQTGPISEGPLRILRKDVGCEVPCYFRSCNYRICMEWLTPEEVFESTVRLLNDAIR